MDITSLTAPLTYEKRIVCFFDVLGWKNHIEDAGSDPKKIGKLAFLPKILASDLVKATSQTSSGRITSFSDCAVVSLPFDADFIPQLLVGLSNIFIGAAINGFFLRAGVTVGDIYHDDKMVFGPALNKAYTLESSGKYPRIILDGDEESLKRTEMDIVFEEDVLFADPFTLSFFRDNETLNNPQKIFMGGPAVNGLAIFLKIETIIAECMEKAKVGRDKEKMTWLYRRVRQQSKSIFSPQFK